MDLGKRVSRFIIDLFEKWTLESVIVDLLFKGDIKSPFNNQRCKMYIVMINQKKLSSNYTNCKDRQGAHAGLKSP